MMPQLNNPGFIFQYSRQVIGNGLNIKNFFLICYRIIISQPHWVSNLIKKNTGTLQPSDYQAVAMAKNAALYILTANTKDASCYIYNCINNIDVVTEWLSYLYYRDTDVKDARSPKSTISP